MRILYLSDIEIPTVHGEALCNAKLIRALISAGHEVFLVSRSKEESNLRYMPMPGWEGIGCEARYIEVGERDFETSSKFINRLFSAINPYWIPSYLNPAWVKAATPVLEIEFDRFKPDVVFTTLPRWNHLAALRLRRKRHFLWVASLNDPWERRTLFADPPWYSHVFRYHRAVISLMASRVDAFIFPSKRLEAFERKFSYGCWPADIGIVPHVGVIASMPKARDKKKFRLMHVGDLCNIGKAACKFPEALAVAVCERPELRAVLDVVFVGDAPDGFKRRMEVAVGEAAQWISWCPYPESLEYIASADVNILIEANYPEGVLMLAKLADYAVARRPILALSPEQGYMADLAREKECLHAATNVPSDISEKILVLYDAWRTGTLDIHAPRELVEICSPEHAAAEFEKLVCSIREKSGESLNDGPFARTSE